MNEGTFEELRALAELARKHGLSELSVETSDAKIRLRRESPVRAAGGPEAAERGRVREICAPLVGVFYRAPAPDAAPYVEVGDWIEPGQSIAVIEAMKVFSEITSEVAGRVAAIPVGNGELVEAGQVLVVVELAE